VKLRVCFLLILIFITILGCNQTIGPATVEELTKMDLSHATKVIVIYESKNTEKISKASVLGSIYGFRTSISFLTGYKGDIEIQDIKGNTLGGITDGKTWVSS